MGTFPLVRPRSLFGGRNREGAAQTRRTSLGKFYPFLTQEAASRMVPNPKRRSTGKKAWGRPSGWNAKIRVLSFKKKKKNPGARLFPSFLRGLEWGWGWRPMCSCRIGSDPRRGAGRGGSSYLSRGGPASDSSVLWSSRLGDVQSGADTPSPRKKAQVDKYKVEGSGLMSFSIKNPFLFNSKISFNDGI